MKGCVIKMAGHISRLTYSLSSIVMVVSILCALALSVIYGYVEFVENKTSVEIKHETLYWLKVSLITLGISVFFYIVLQPIVPLLRIVSRREIIDMEKRIPERAYSKILSFYKKYAAINPFIIERIRKGSEEDDLSLLYSRYLKK